MANYKHSQLKNKSFKEIQMLFNNTMKWIESFVPMDTELVKGSEKAVEGSSKRVGGKLEQEDAKRQRIEEENKSIELKRCLEIIHDDNDDVTNKATPLSSKSPTIVDYKIYTEGWKIFFKIIRVDGSTIIRLPLVIFMIVFLNQMIKDLFEAKTTWLDLIMLQTDGMKYFLFSSMDLLIRPSGVYLQKLVLDASVDLIWQERNLRTFQVEIEVFDAADILEFLVNYVTGSNRVHFSSWHSGGAGVFKDFPSRTISLLWRVEPNVAINDARSATDSHDSVHFDVTFFSINPDRHVIAPWRGCDIAGRKDSIEYVKKHNVPVPVTKKSIYNRDMNLCHLSHEEIVHMELGIRVLQEREVQKTSLLETTKLKHELLDNSSRNGKEKKLARKRDLTEISVRKMLWISGLYWLLALPCYTIVTVVHPLARTWKESQLATYLSSLLLMESFIYLIHVEQAKEVLKELKTMVIKTAMLTGELSSCSKSSKTLKFSVRGQPHHHPRSPLPALPPVITTRTSPPTTQLPDVTSSSTAGNMLPEIASCRLAAESPEKAGPHKF
nr:argininosuccinate synthase, chloroplastic isoform X1 [Tanacetum cinerariifolium]